MSTNTANAVCGVLVDYVFAPTLRENGFLYGNLHSKFSMKKAIAARIQKYRKTYISIR